MTSHNRHVLGPGTDMKYEQVLATGKWLFNSAFIAPHTPSVKFSGMCSHSHRCEHTLTVNGGTTSRHHKSKVNRRCYWKATVCMCEAAAWLGRDVRHWAWQVFDERSLQLSVCVCIKGGKRACLGMQVCAVDVAVCERVRARREFMRWHLISCLTFPVSQGSS